MNLNLKSEIIKKYGSQIEFAKVIKISKSVISKILRGRRPPTAIQQEIFAEALDCKLEDIFEAKVTKGKYLPTKCPICGIIFTPRKNHGKTQEFCSRECSSAARKKTICSCGSADLDPRCRAVGGPYNKTLCVNCFNDWYRNRNYQEFACTICGRITRTRPRRSIEAEIKYHVCQKCVPNFGSCKVYFKTCQCGSQFTTREKDQKYCSPACVYKYVHISSTICSDCGKEIKPSDKGHKSTSSVCDQCMWIRRRKYKLRAKAPKILTDEEIEKIVLLDIFSKYGQLKIQKERINQCQIQKLMERAQTLLEKYL